MSLYIPHVEYGIDAQYIANVFYFQNLATVKRITLVPYMKPVGKFDMMCYQRAYVDIDMWHDSEAAYSFIQRVLSPEKEARLIYDIIDEACWWVVEKNMKPWITMWPTLAKNTTEFEIMDNDEAIEDILFDLELEDFFRDEEKQSISEEELEELERYVHPIDDDLEWEELEHLINEEKQNPVVIEV